LEIGLAKFGGCSSASAEEEEKSINIDPTERNRVALEVLPLEIKPQCRNFTDLVREDVKIKGVLHAIGDR